MIESKVLEKLEFNKIQAMIADLALSEEGRNRAAAIKPITDFDFVNQRLDETGEAMEALRFGEISFLSGLKQVQHQLRKARVNGILIGSELRDIHRLLFAARMARRYVQGGKYSRLSLLCSELEENRDLENYIDRAISEDGQIRDDASPELKRLRNQTNTFRLRIKDYLQNFIRSGDNQKLLQDALVTERDGRYVVPVKQEYRSMVKGIVHDESASGATVYIEPLPVVELNNRMRSLQMEEKREIEKILRDLSGRVDEFGTELERNQEILGVMDFVFARARLAYKMNAFRPVVNMRGIIEINRGKHPLLGESAVPVNVELGKGFDLLVITGPNTGGKTVTLKTIGLLVLMAMSGLYIPARENSRVAIFNSIYVDIGDEQSIEQSLSTFSAHMKNIINILSRADRRSLVLLDELGAGTDPVEGSALGRVILEELKSNEAKAVVTTHQSELKYYAYQNERVENACVEFDPVNLKPTYELTIGMPGQSNAFEIATRLGMDKSMVQRARDLVPQREKEVGDMIRQLKESHYNLDKESREVQRLKDVMLQEQEKFLQEKQAFKEEHRQLMLKSREEAAREVRQAKQQAQDALQEFKELLKDKENPPKWHEIEEKRQKLKKIGMLDEPSHEYSTSSSRDQEIIPGDYVLITGIDQKGYVLGTSAQGEMNVQVGSIKFNTKKENLVKLDTPAEIKVKLRGESFLDKARHISKEIDVRGKLSEDAIIEIDKYLGDAALVGLDSVRLIHGKGTGALRTAVRAYLKKHPLVKTFRDGLPEEGGNGVTVVEIK